ncbi:response regulator [Radiobacillus sp. PE A8.2]|uniref:response regulator transcription factor n=1 Tax=Radiobacillus sp. PE A8.2 TaxID=3380349 RepID=UPI00388FF5B7
MKAIIIDDEKHVREGIQLLADWDEVGINKVYEAKDGEEGIELIEKYQPEIIFTDMRMPNKDGISLLNWIHGSNLASETIVVSGYDDFHYMRSALFYGSFDYILKPINPVTLNTTLKNAVEKWRMQANKRETMIENNQVINEVKPLYWDQLFTSIINRSEVKDATNRKISKEFGVDLNKVTSTVSILSICPLFMEKFNVNKEVTYFALLNIINEVISGKGSGFGFRNVNKEHELIILLWKTEQQQFLLEKIHNKIYQYLKIKCTIFMGDESDCAHISYQSASSLFKKVDLTKSKKVVKLEELEQRPSLHLLDYAQELKWTLQSDSKEQMDMLLDKLFDKLQHEHHVSLEQLKLWEDQFLLLKKNWLKEYDVHEETIDNIRNQYWNDDGTFSLAAFKREKQQEFYDLLKILKKIKYQKERSSIQEIEAYLRVNYQYDISLQDIADQFFLSREYISRKFKHEYQVTLTDYMTEIRMEKSKELLANPHLKIYDIAFEVGYKNDKYFSKVFKKTNGLTPNEYRNQLIENVKSQKL